MRQLLAILMMAVCALPACGLKNTDDGCKKGKRCGNSCIARDKTCHKQDPGEANDDFEGVYASR